MQLTMLSGVSFQKPSTILLLAVFSGWERFFMDDILMGILKVLTCYGCMIWWLVDIFTARSGAQKYNLRQFDKIIMTSSTNLLPGLPIRFS